MKRCAEPDVAALLFEFGAPKHLRDVIAHERHASLSPHQDNLVEIRCFELRIGQCPDTMLTGALDNWPCQLFEFCSREFVTEAESIGEKWKSNARFWVG